eukprot:TRINITY_DN9966_c0_g1_i3.p2 TRINITY_DN9966_c0_g1~~TRINITY_DN9966_c0_g1_i3.p2  ORF type:complete len:110 (+),score=2.18 TRINITY_DN9966_c0_g1_i3:374-703(+)
MLSNFMQQFMLQNPKQQNELKITHNVNNNNNILKGKNQFETNYSRFSNNISNFYFEFLSPRAEFRYQSQQIQTFVNTNFSQNTKNCKHINNAQKYFNGLHYQLQRRQHL